MPIHRRSMPLPVGHPTRLAMAMSAAFKLVRYFVPVAVFVGLGYMLWSSMENYQLRERVRREAAAARASATKTEVLRMAARSSAVVDWPLRLAPDHSFRMSQVHTAELQSLWISQRPILFVGRIEDIARSTPGTSLITVTFDDMAQSHASVGTRLQLRVECPDDVVGPLFSSVTRPAPLGADAALVARITGVEQSVSRGETGDLDRVLVGVGTCSDAMHLPDSLRW